MVKEYEINKKVRNRLKRMNAALIPLNVVIVLLYIYSVFFNGNRGRGLFLDLILPSILIGIFGVTIFFNIRNWKLLSNNFYIKIDSETIYIREPNIFFKVIIHSIPLATIKEGKINVVGDILIKTEEAEHEIRKELISEEDFKDILEKVSP